MWICITGICAVTSASAQLGSVTGAVSGTVQSTTRATATLPATPSPGATHDVFSSTNIAQNAALSSQVSALVPSSSTLPAAASGFQSDSEFITALHAAHNLNVPFERLKADTTGKGSVSMEAAIRKLRPDLDSKTVKESLNLAQRQSERDIAQASAGNKDKVSSRITSNDRLAAQLNPLVPQGQTLSQAAAGFKNEEQFMSTLHAANDNGIAFADLKDRVTAGQSLGAAMHDLKPSMDTNASASAAARAETQAKSDKVEASASASARANGK